MENKTLGILLGIGLYLILCAVIAGVRALLSGRGEQGTRFSLVLMAGKAGAGRDGPVARCAVIVRMPAVSPNSRL